MIKVFTLVAGCAKTAVEAMERMEKGNVFEVEKTLAYRALIPRKDE